MCAILWKDKFYETQTWNRVYKNSPKNSGVIYKKISFDIKTKDLINESSKVIIIVPRGFGEIYKSLSINRFKLITFKKQKIQDIKKVK